MKRTFWVAFATGLVSALIGGGAAWEIRPRLAAASSDEGAVVFQNANWIVRRNVTLTGKVICKALSRSGNAYMTSQGLFIPASVNFSSYTVQIDKDERSRATSGPSAFEQTQNVIAIDDPDYFERARRSGTLNGDMLGMRDFSVPMAGSEEAFTALKACR